MGLCIMFLNSCFFCFWKSFENVVCGGTRTEESAGLSLSFSRMSLIHIESLGDNIRLLVSARRLSCVPLVHGADGVS